MTTDQEEGCTPPLSQSAKLFQERRIPEDRVTRRLPSPRSNLCRNRVHQIPLHPPHPWPDVLHSQGTHTTDGGMTKAWPHGEFEICGT